MLSNKFCQKNVPTVYFKKGPEASISLSLLKARQSTASSIIIKFSAAWYFRSLRILPVVKFHTWTHMLRIIKKAICEILFFDPDLISRRCGGLVVRVLAYRSPVPGSILGPGPPHSVV